jgi:hypothetical protein
MGVRSTGVSDASESVRESVPRVPSWRALLTLIWWSDEEQLEREVNIAGEATEVGDGLDLPVTR